MKGIAIQLKKTAGRKEMGVSKLFGSPDVWSGFEWPAITDGGNCYDLDFLAQINCGDASVFDHSGLFPNSGMLYFFYDFVGCPTDMEDPNAARVLYYNGNTQALDELTMVDDQGVDCAIATARHISFSAVGSNTNSAGLKLCYEDGDLEDYVVLLKINSFSALNGELKFNDIGSLLFLIDKDKLKALDFSDVRVTVKYKQ